MVIPAKCKEQEPLRPAGVTSTPNGCNRPHSIRTFGTDDPETHASHLTRIAVLVVKLLLVNIPQFNDAGKGQSSPTS